VDTSTARLLTLIDAFRGRKVAVVGDLIADEFIYGRVARVSREAPVLILNYDATEIVPGGAGNAARNVAALGGSVRAVGITGDDEPGRRVLEVLGTEVDVRGVARPRGWRTPTKTRILAGGIHSAKQQVVRIDRAAEQRHGRVRAAAAAAGARGAPMRRRSAVRLRSGWSHQRSPQRCAASWDAGRFVDCVTSCQIPRHHGVHPNEAEVEQLPGITVDDDLRTLERTGRELPNVCVRRPC
jgi:hypothetical protein